MRVSTKDASLASALPYRALRAGGHLETPATEGLMRTYRTGDSWTDAYLIRADERMAEACAYVARRALLRDARPPRRPARVWLGSILLAAGHRLLGTGPAAVATA